MIVVDTSALMAILLGEPQSSACLSVLEGDDSPVISAGTMGEALIVAGRRAIGAEMARLIEGFAFDIVPVTQVSARLMADAYALWGKGVHPAGLNLGDCFAYVAAQERGCPLLHVGNDFALTNVASALP